MPDKPKEVTAFTEPTPPDSKSEPPKGFPAMCVLTWWVWVHGDWRVRCSMFPMNRTQAIDESAKLIALGCRLVRIITIPGEPPNA